MTNPPLCILADIIKSIYGPDVYQIIGQDNSLFSKLTGMEDDLSNDLISCFDSFNRVTFPTPILIGIDNRHFPYIIIVAKETTTGKIHHYLLTQREAIIEVNFSDNSYKTVPGYELVLVYSTYTIAKIAKIMTEVREEKHLTPGWIYSNKEDFDEFIELLMYSKTMKKDKELVLCFPNPDKKSFLPNKERCGNGRRNRD